MLVYCSDVLHVDLEPFVSVSAGLVDFLHG